MDYVAEPLADFTSRTVQDYPLVTLTSSVADIIKVALIIVGLNVVQYS